MLSLDRIDLEMLADLLDQRDDGAGYLDPGTGEIHPAFEGEIMGLEDPEDEDAVEELIALGGSSGRRTYRDMELFAHWVGDRRTRGQLTEALEGPKPMRAFRSVVHSTPERLGPVWERFHSLRAQLRALDFLGTPSFDRDQLVADAELEARRAHVVEEADTLLDGLGRERQGRLILLNGLPGVGKSTLAQAYVADRPGALNLDIDVLRTLIGGPWEETAELGRTLALSLIESHLDAGHDVVVPQLIADPDQLIRFDEAAGDASVLVVHLQGASRAGDQPWQQEVTPKQMESYRQGLDRLASLRPDLETIEIGDGDVAAALSALEALLITALGR